MVVVKASEFEDFVLGSSSALFRMAMLLVGERSDAQDLLQTAYERTLRHWNTASAGDPTAYARRALANAATDSWRRRIAFARLPRLPVGSVTDADAFLAVETHDVLIQGLLQLPARQRTVLVLRYWEDLSEESTAETMGCSVGSVKSQASRGLSQLRASFTTTPLI